MNNVQETTNTEFELAKMKNKYEVLLANHKNLEESFDHLKLECKSAVEENASNYKLLENLETVIQEKPVKLKTYSLQLLISDIMKNCLTPSVPKCLHF